MFIVVVPFDTFITTEAAFRFVCIIGIDSEVWIGFSFCYGTLSFTIIFFFDLLLVLDGEY